MGRRLFARWILVLGLAIPLSGCQRWTIDPQAVEEDFVTLSGDQFTIYKGESGHDPDLGDFYSVSVYAPDNLPAASLRKLEDAVFAGYAGDLAELKAIHTVRVLHFADKAHYEDFARDEFDNDEYRAARQHFQADAKHLGLDGTWLANAAWYVWSAVTGYRRHDMSATQAALYKRGAEGVWTRDGRHPGPPPHLREVTLDDGARFALTGSFNRPKDHVLFYECLSCRGDEDVDGVMKDFPKFMQSVVRPDAEQYGRSGAVRICIFAGQRKDLWHFPSSMELRVDPKQESWVEGARQVAPGLRKLWISNLRGSRSGNFISFGASPAE